MYFITDRIRGNICDSIGDSANIPFLSLGDYYLLRNNLNFEMMLVDFYNILAIKKYMGEINEEESIFFLLLNSESVDKLNQMKYDPDFLECGICALTTFNDLSKLDRYEIIRMLETIRDDNDLTRRALYKINVMSNIPSYGAKDLLGYYNDYIEKNGDDLDNRNQCIEIIVEYIKDMRRNYTKEYKENIALAIVSAYKNEKYLKVTRNSKETWERFKFLKTIEWLNSERLLKLIDRDEEFMFQIISEYFYYENISENLKGSLDCHFAKTLSKKMKRKFEKIKEDI